MVSRPAKLSFAGGAPKTGDAGNAASSASAQIRAEWILQARGFMDLDRRNSSERGYSSIRVFNGWLAAASQVWSFTIDERKILFVPRANSRTVCTFPNSHGSHFQISGDSHEQQGFAPAHDPNRNGSASSAVLRRRRGI
jgi:hypothetical protein